MVALWLVYLTPDSEDRGLNPLGPLVMGCALSKTQHSMLLINTKEEMTETLNHKVHYMIQLRRLTI